MRAFIVLCLVTLACADKLGYNYRPVDHSSSGLSFTPGGATGGLDFGTGGGNGGLDFGPGTGGGSGGLNFGPGSGSGSHSSPSFAPQGEVEKEFYTFSANEDDFVEPAASNQYANGGKQGLRVIFIKGPENNGLEDAALGLARQAAEQRTAIYVLNKQHDLSDLANKLKDANSNINNKPEVHFVKYRTPEDAANAQRAIQGQYDQLGGPSQHYNGGVAPALNFASASPSHGSYGGVAAPSSSYLSPGSGFGSSGFGAAPSVNYLPASLRRRYRLK